MIVGGFVNLDGPDRFEAAQGNDLRNFLIINLATNPQCQVASSNCFSRLQASGPSSVHDTSTPKP